MGPAISAIYESMACWAHLSARQSREYGESMAQVQPWFERSFDFSFPAELYPNLKARLRGTPARLEEITSNCDRDTLVRKFEQKWSAQEHAGHLLDLEPLWLARVNDFVAGVTVLTPADLSNQKTHQANHNAGPIETILRDFRAARLELMHRVEEIDPAQFSRTILHPRLKQPMRLMDHLYFVAEHDDHHLAQIWEITEHETKEEKFGR
jgi:uncharacterized damage-inducible protein DinB